MPLIKVVGLDLAKLVFSIHGVEEYGKTKLSKSVKRNRLLAEVAKLPQCVSGGLRELLEFNFMCLQRRPVY